MTEHWQQDLRLLLANSNIAFLATQGEQTPEASMVPYALFEGDILLHLSALARHHQNIRRNPAVGLMICTPESGSNSPLALPRVSFAGSIKPVSSNATEQAKAVYLQKIPDAKPLFSFADFSLYRLSVESIYWVGGFGAAQKISLKSWRSFVCQTY